MLVVRKKIKIFRMFAEFGMTTVVAIEYNQKQRANASTFTAPH